MSDHDDVAGAREEQGDPVWALLGQSRRPEPDGWFAARTLARCRHEGVTVEPREAVLGRVWRGALVSGLGVSLAVFITAQMHPAPESGPNQKSVQEAFEIMATMTPDADPASSSSNGSSWQDSSL